MTNLERYIALAECEWEYSRKMPGDVDRVGLVKTGSEDYPEVIEIHWKSGGKSGIGNPRIVEAVKPYMGDIGKFCELVKKLINEDIAKLRPAAQAEAERTRPWTYILGVLDDSGHRVGRYSWYEDNSWELFGMSDQKLLQDRIESCRRFRSESTSRWHVYKRMRGDTSLVLVF